MQNELSEFKCSPSDEDGVFGMQGIEAWKGVDPVPLREGEKEGNYVQK